LGEEEAEEEEQNKKKKRKGSHDFWSDACIFIYRMIQDERSIIWVSVRKKFHMNMCLILSGY
jgi:hypothetical protein